MGTLQKAKVMTPETSVKKGNTSWKPAARLIAKIPPGYRGRWVDKDPANMAKKLAEGWEIANPTNGTHGASAQHQPTKLVQDGKPLTSVTEYRESVLMLTPEENAQARERYFSDLTRQQTAGLKRKAEGDDQSNAAKHGARPKGVRGSIVIE